MRLCHDEATVLAPFSCLIIVAASVTVEYDLNGGERIVALVGRGLEVAEGSTVGLGVAETFVDPARFSGTMYRAAGWTGLGLTKGYAHANGRYTDPHGEPKEILVRALRQGARQALQHDSPGPDTSPCVHPWPSDSAESVPKHTSPLAVLLRESYRHNGRVKKCTLANLAFRLMSRWTMLRL